MTPDDIKQMTGEAANVRPRLTPRKAIRINGKKGTVLMTHLDESKELVNGEERYKQEELSGPMDVVFLKIRRRLMQGSKSDGIVKYTTEHDTVNDVVTLFQKDSDETITAPASEIRKQHEGLKTEQIVYVRFKGNICKLSIKGLSLKGTDDTTNFYQYITNNHDLHTFVTKVIPVSADLDGDTYHFFDFKRGADLTPEQLDAVIKDIREVHENCVEVEKAYQKSAPAPEPKPEVATSGVEYPEEELNPEDVPFN